MGTIAIQKIMRIVLKLTNKAKDQRRLVIATVIALWPPNQLVCFSYGSICNASDFVPVVSVTGRRNTDFPFNNPTRSLTWNFHSLLSFCPDSRSTIKRFFLSLYPAVLLKHNSPLRLMRDVHPMLFCFLLLRYCVRKSLFACVCVYTCSQLGGVALIRKWLSQQSLVPDSCGQGIDSF